MSYHNTNTIYYQSEIDQHYPESRVGAIPPPPPPPPNTHTHTRPHNFFFFLIHNYAGHSYRTAQSSKRRQLS